MSKVHVFDHPLIQHKVTHMRDKNTGTKKFRELVNEVSGLMVYEITRDMPLQDITIETPLVEATCKVIDDKKLVLVPILRAGLGMVEGILDLIPMAKVGHLGMYRDPETLEPVEYYSKLPSDLALRELLVIDPMLATGGSAAQGVHVLKRMGAKRIKLVTLLAAPEGIEHFQQEHADVDIYVAALDEKLNHKSYIIPGLGDAGDRLFGTK